MLRLKCSPVFVREVSIKRKWIVKQKLISLHVFFSLQLSTSFVLETFIHSKEKVTHTLTLLLDSFSLLTFGHNLTDVPVVPPAHHAAVDRAPHQTVQQQPGCLRGSVTALPPVSSQCWSCFCSTQRHSVHTFFFCFSGFWIGWLMTTGGRCRSS